MLDEFRKAIKTTEPYYLCLGNCYILAIKSEHRKMFDLPVYYVNFQGASDKGLYCYSLLKNCRGVFLFSAWANIASVITTKYFYHWRKILDELLQLDCPVVMVEAPISQKYYRHPDTGKGVSIETLDLKRATYVHEVIDVVAHPNFIHQDMVNLVGYDTKYLVDKYPTKAPWHLSNTAVKKVTRYFVRVVIAGKDSSEMPLIL